MKKIIETAKYKGIPAMTPPVVHSYLGEIGRKWKKKGVVVELGSWLGATAVSLLEGLVQAGYDVPFYAYDIWKAHEEQVRKAEDQGVELQIEENLLPLFMQNVSKVYPASKIMANRGYISDTIREYPPQPIEICLFDAPKREPVFSNVVRRLSPYWIPGVTILGLLDYYFYKSKKGEKQEVFRAPVKFIEEHEGCFEKIAEWPDKCNCVFFKYIKKL